MNLTNTGAPCLLVLILIFVLISYGPQISLFFRKIFSPYDYFTIPKKVEIFDVVRGNTSYTKTYQYRRHIVKAIWQRKEECGISIEEDFMGRIEISIKWKWLNVPDYERGHLELMLRNEKTSRK